MPKHNVQIEEKVYQEVKEYCDLNKLKINEYISGLVKRGLNEDKFGDAPFLPKKTVVDRELEDDNIQHFRSPQGYTYELNKKTGELKSNYQESFGDYVIPEEKTEEVKPKTTKRRLK